LITIIDDYDELQLYVSSSSAVPQKVSLLTERFRTVYHVKHMEAVRMPSWQQNEGTNTLLAADLHVQGITLLFSADIFPPFAFQSNYW